ncbi:MAG: transglutaminase family protein, partial [Planctomycetaceae bacterium]|nr:transglutaminase family protein [Planctomycetaceae bacterium]
MKYKITHSTKYAYSQAVPVCHNLVHLAPRALPNQMCNEFQLLIHPEPFSITHRKDYFGNDVSYFSIDQAHLGLSVTATS